MSADADGDALIRAMRAAGDAGVPVLLWSPPGMGKSALVEGMAAQEDLLCETVVGSIREPADFSGLPVVRDDGDVRLAPPAWAKRLRQAGQGVLFLDELSTAPPAVQAAMLRVVRERWVGDERLPDQVRIIAAANPADCAADGWELAPPMANRFLHLDWQPASDVWFSGMLTGFERQTPRMLTGAEVTPEREAASRAQVVAFLRGKPQLLDAMPDPHDPAAGKAWPSRRSWEYTARVLARLPDADVAARTTAACGLVGEGAGVELMHHLQYMDLPPASEVLSDPSLFDPTDSADRVWTVLSGVVAVAAERGTSTAWTEAQRVLARAATDGQRDVAATAFRDLERIRPQGGVWSKKLTTAFGELVNDAALDQRASL